MSGDAYRLRRGLFRQAVERHPDGSPKRVIKHRFGAKITGLSDAEARRMLASGTIVPWVDDPEPADGGPAPDEVVEPDQADGDGDEPDHAPGDGVEPAARPRITATKKVWVEYAMTRGWSREDAEKLDKSDLIDRLS